ncbi:phage/plasmid replication protein [uncultured Alistipes sp.]|uniref:phage/plasmid replication domain-containing protein n=1 Tax=uncultured Alistipes sp. TaxID=538949 RepID=UPI00266C657F|nr:phage/plasmid replication protein [uncultured Alistipes sp.]
MIKLDKIKIVSSIDYIKIIDENRFDIYCKENDIVSYKFTQIQPYLLYVEANIKNQELIVEFTGKLLKDDYPSLINIDNIKDCLLSINELGFSLLDVDNILISGEVVKVDVTQDVPYPDCGELTKMIQANISNFRKYLPRIINRNFTIEKNVVTKSYKCRLTVYDKNKELKRVENKLFLSQLLDKQKLLNYFEGKVRFEMNLNSKEQIRKALHITDLSVDSVLSANVNPIWEFLDQILVDADSIDITAKCDDLKELLRGALLQVCDYDIKKVEAQLRLHSSPNTHISQTLKPFRELLKKINNTPTLPLKQTLQSLLLEIMIFFAAVAI